MEDISKMLKTEGYWSFLGGMGKYVWFYFTIFIVLILFFWWLSNVTTFQGDKIGHLCVSINWLAFFYALIYTLRLCGLNSAGLLSCLPHPIALKAASFIALLLCVGSLSYLVLYRNNLYVSKAYKIALIIGMILGLIFNKLICGSALLFFPTILVCLALIVWGVIKF